MATEQSTYKVVFQVVGNQEGFPEVNKAIQEMNGYLDRTGEKVGLVTKTLKFLGENADRIGKTFDGFKNAINSFGVLAGEAISLNSAFKTTIEYSKNLISLSSQFSKYGVGITQIENSFIKLGKEISLTRAETMKLFSAYEKGFPMATLEGAERLFKNIQKVVGSNAQAMQEMQNILSNLASTYPEIQSQLERMNSIDKERLKNQTNLLLMTGKISLQEAKRLTDYASANQQISAADKIRLDQEKANVEAVQKIKIQFEKISLELGQNFLPLFNKAVDWINKYGDTVKEIAGFFGKWVVPLMVVKSIVTNIFGLGKVLFGAVGGMVGSLTGMGKGSGRQEPPLPRLGGSGPLRVNVDNHAQIGSSTAAMINRTSAMGSAAGGAAIMGGPSGKTGGRFGRAMGGVGKGLGYASMIAGMGFLGAEALGLGGGEEESGKMSSGKMALEGAGMGGMLGPMGALVGGLTGVLVPFIADMTGLTKDIEKAGGLWNFVSQGASSMWEQIKLSASDFWDKITGSADEWSKKVNENASNYEKIRSEKMVAGKGAANILRSQGVDLSKEVKEGGAISFAYESQVKLVYDNIIKLTQEGKTKEAAELKKFADKLKSLSGELSKSSLAFIDAQEKRLKGLAGTVPGYKSETKEGPQFTNINKILGEMKKPLEATGKEEFKNIESAYRQRKIMEGDLTGSIKEREAAEKEAQAAEAGRDRALGSRHKEIGKKVQSMEENKEGIVKRYETEAVSQGYKKEEAESRASKQFEEDKKALLEEQKGIEDKNADVIKKANESREKAKRISDDMLIGLNNQKLVMEAQVKLADSLSSKFSTTVTYMAQIGKINMEELEKQQDAAINAINESSKLIQTQVNLAKEYSAESSKPNKDKEKERDLALQYIDAQLKGEKNEEKRKELEAIRTKLLDKNYNLSTDSVAIGVLEKTTTASIVDSQKQLLENENKKFEIRKQAQHVYDGQLQNAQLEVQYANDLVSLYDSIGSGIGASAEMRMASIGQMEKQRSILKEQYAIVQKNYEEAVKANKEQDQIGLLNEMKRIRNEMLGITKQEADQVKSLRDGWIGAINASTVGSGRISKIVMGQEQSTGMALQFLKGMATSMKSGSLSGGYTTSEKFNIAGGITGSKAFAPYKTTAGGMLMGEQGAMREALQKQDFDKLGDILTGAVRQGISKGLTGGMSLQAYGAGGPGASALTEAALKNSKIPEFEKKQKELAEKGAELQKQMRDGTISEKEYNAKNQKIEEDKKANEKAANEELQKVIRESSGIPILEQIRDALVKPGALDKKIVEEQKKESKMTGKYTNEIYKTKTEYDKKIEEEGKGWDDLINEETDEQSKKQLQESKKQNLSILENEKKSKLGELYKQEREELNKSAPGTATPVTSAATTAIAATPSITNTPVATGTPSITITLSLEDIKSVPKLYNGVVQIFNTEFDKKTNNLNGQRTGTN